MSEESRSRALAAALALEESLKRAAAGIPEIADLSNEELIDAERRFSNLHDQAALIWKWYGLELMRRRSDGRVESPASPLEAIFKTITGRGTPPLRTFLIT
jgi:hypothetical protein